MQDAAKLREFHRLMDKPMRRNPLSAAMSNVHAWVLGEVCRKAADDPNVGDYIDRGLILRRMLEEEGYAIVYVGDQPR